VREADRGVFGVSALEDSSGIGDDWAISLSKGVRCCALAGGNGQVTARSIPEWRSKYFHLAMRRGRKIAKVAMGGDWLSLAIDVAQGMELRAVRKFGSHAGKLEQAMGVQ